MANPILYSSAEIKANQIEAELKRLNRWSDKQLPDEKFQNMGAFGQNTMAFEQWLQFILIPRIREIINDKEEFPANSMLATYAIRVFNGVAGTDDLHSLLYELDELINHPEKKESDTVGQHDEVPVHTPVDSTSFSDATVPEVMITLAAVLNQFEGSDLESQLQTYDVFLNSLAPSVRPQISNLLMQASMKAANPATRRRIEQAAHSVLTGGRAAEPYDHVNAMKKYMNDHKESFPST